MNIHEETLNIARYLIKKHPSLTDWVISKFPELKESEDEKIRKELICYFEKYPSIAIGPFNTKECIAWLEKQGEVVVDKELSDLLNKVICHFINEPNIPYSERDEVSKKIIPYVKELEKQGEQKTTISDEALREGILKFGITQYQIDNWLKKHINVVEQKPADKVEPKFHEGDWITNGEFSTQIVAVGSGLYVINRKDMSEVSLSIKYVEKWYHLWTIQDAKDGDVLTWDNGRYIILFKKDNIVAHCSYNIHSKHFGFSSNYDTQFDCIFNFTPATKEQRDLLFQKMKEVGYEWDAEKRELKKIEDEEYNGEDYGIDSLYHAQRILEKTLGKVDGYQTDDGILEHKCAISAVKSLYEQKPADINPLLSWSSEEEKMLQCLEGIVKDYWAKAEQEKNEIKIKEASNVSYFLKTIQKSPLCWIKCSDRLPNRDGIYLVVTDGRYNDVYDIARYDSIEGWHKASEIICWMPIPKLNNKSIIKQKPATMSLDEAIEHCKEKSCGNNACALEHKQLER